MILRDILLKKVSRNNPLLQLAMRKKMLYELAALQPKILATMRGSSYSGNRAQVLRDLDHVMRDVWDEKKIVEATL